VKRFLVIGGLFTALMTHAANAQMSPSLIKSFCGNGMEANAAGISFYGQTYTQEWKANMIASGDWKGEENFWRRIREIHAAVARSCPSIW
jgi:hypothetical protein